VYVDDTNVFRTYDATVRTISTCSDTDRERERERERESDGYRDRKRVDVYASGDIVSWAVLLECIIFLSA